jgi:hypothetical protein
MLLTIAINPGVCNYCWHIFFVETAELNSSGMKKQTGSTQDNKATKSNEEISKEYDKLTKEAEQQARPKKPGSQSNSSDRHNNGRGGGK